MNKTAAVQQPKTASFLPPVQGLLQRKCACGNHTVAGGECAECAKKTVLQRKLTIGASNDPLELEADWVADQVMAAPTHSTTSRAPLRIQRFAGQMTEGTDTAPASVDRVLASSGRPLESGLRQDMEQRFGHDFSRVRVHSGGAAEQSAKDVNANAYTVGHNIVFGAGQFAPETHGGRRLIAHELTHVVQQSGAVQRDKAGTKADSKPQNTQSERKEAMAQVTAIETNWKKLKKISSGFAETKGWISMGDKVVALIREHSTRYLDASAAGDKELVNDYLFLTESDLVAYQYVTWHAFVYSNLARIRPDINNLVSSFDHDDTHYTGRADVEPGIRELKKWLDVLATDSANTLNDMYLGQTKARAGQTNEVTLTVTTAADKKKRAVLEAETRKIREMQITVQGVLAHTNKFLRNATWEGVKYAAEAVKEFIEVRNKIIDSSGGPDYDDKGHLEGDEGKSGDEPAQGDDKSKKDRCYKKYLEQTAYCGETYTDDNLYNTCMTNAWKNYIRCLNGLPPQPLVPNK